MQKMCLGAAAIYLAAMLPSEAQIAERDMREILNSAESTGRLEAELVYCGLPNDGPRITRQFMDEMIIDRCTANVRATNSQIRRINEIYYAARDRRFRDLAGSGIVCRSRRDAFDTASEGLLEMRRLARNNICLLD